MPLITEHFAFYHCPRTGGTWVREVLRELGIEYRYQGHAHSTPAESPSRKFSFTIRRYVGDWLRSWRHLVDSEPQWSWPVQPWLLNAKTDGDAQGVFRRYADNCHAVIQTEDLRTGLQVVFDSVGLDLEVPDMPPVNEGSHA